MALFGDGRVIRPASRCTIFALRAEATVIAAADDRPEPEVPGSIDGVLASVVAAATFSEPTRRL